VRGPWSAGMVVLGALAWAGCSGRAELYVECAPDRDGLRCTVEHQKGNDTAKACWDVTFTCRNGTEARGSACQVVEPGGKAVTRMPLREIRNADRCDLITKSGVENLSVSRPD
jgi:hypothetical protein